MITREDRRLMWLKGRDWMNLDEIWDAAANEPWLPATKGRMWKFLLSAWRVKSLGVETQWDPRGGNVVQWRVR